jgi:hypothetical protein
MIFNRGFNGLNGWEAKSMGDWPQKPEKAQRGGKRLGSSWTSLGISQVQGAWKSV